MVTTVRKPFHGGSAPCYFSGLLFRFILFDGRTGGARRGVPNSLTTSNGKSLHTQVVTIDLQKKNKHSINISPENTTSSPKNPTLITLRSNPLNLLTTPLRSSSFLDQVPENWNLPPEGQHSPEKKSHPGWGVNQFGRTGPIIWGWKKTWTHMFPYPPKVFHIEPEFLGTKGIADSYFWEFHHLF